MQEWLSWKTDLEKDTVDTWPGSGTQPEKEKVSPASDEQLSRKQNFRAQEQLLKLFF